MTDYIKDKVKDYNNKHDIYINEKKLSNLQNSLTKYSNVHDNVLKIKNTLDCMIIKKAFNDLINNKISNNIDKIHKNEIIYSKDFNVNNINKNNIGLFENMKTEDFHLKMSTDCDIDVKSIEEKIHKFTGLKNKIFMQNDGELLGFNSRLGIKFFKEI